MSSMLDLSQWCDIYTYTVCPLTVYMLISNTSNQLSWKFTRKTYFLPYQCLGRYDYHWHCTFKSPHMRLSNKAKVRKTKTKKKGKKSVFFFLFWKRGGSRIGRETGKGRKERILSVFRTRCGLSVVSGVRLRAAGKRIPLPMFEMQSYSNRRNKCKSCNPSRKECRICAANSPNNLVGCIWRECCLFLKERDKLEGEGIIDVWHWKILKHEMTDVQTTNYKDEKNQAEKRLWKLWLC